MLRTLLLDGVAMYRYRYIHGFNEAMTTLAARALRLGITAKSDSAAMRIGGGVHALLLEGQEAFAREFAVAPQLTPGKPKDKPTLFTRQQRNEWAKFVAANPGKEALTAPEAATIRLISSSILTRRDGEPENVTRARIALTGSGASEYSYAWTDPETGILCRVRFDRLFVLRDGRKIKLEVKVTGDPRPWKFWNHYKRMGWHIQAGFYDEGAEYLLGHRPHEDWCLAIRNQPPYEAVMYRVPEGLIYSGREEVRRGLTEIAERTASGDWFARYERELQTLEAL